MIWAVWEPCNPLLRVHIDDDTMICDIWVDILHVSISIQLCIYMSRHCTYANSVYVHTCRSFEATCHWICCGHWSRHRSYGSKMSKKGSITTTGLLSKELRDKNICLDSRAGISSLILGLKDTCVFIDYTYLYVSTSTYTYLYTYPYTCVYIYT